MSAMVRVVIRIDMYGRITAEARAGVVPLSVKTRAETPVDVSGGRVCGQDQSQINGTDALTKAWASRGGST
jgi:hypothetical protein